MSKRRHLPPPLPPGILSDRELLEGCYSALHGDGSKDNPGMILEVDRLKTQARTVRALSMAMMLGLITAAGEWMWNRGSK